MKTQANNCKQQSVPNQPRKLATFIALATLALMLTACASEMKPNDGAVAARNKLTSLQGNNNLASRAPVEIRDADVAVKAAEQSKGDAVTTQHLVTIADEKVDIASAWAQSRFYEDQRKDLRAQSEAARLEARTLEADRARSDAASARNQATIARNDADVARTDTSNARSETAAALTATAAAQEQSADARSDANVARTDANNARNQTDLAREDTAAARAEAADLQRQIVELNAKKTDRGLVVTLGDVLFETGKSELRGGTPENLDKLASFLKRHETRTAMIEGNTDNVGTESSNLLLSQRRADAVQSYLVNRGVNSTRITTSGLGETSPVASNETATGRQQNRRVEVIISNATL